MHRGFHTIFRGLSKERIEEIKETLEPFTYENDDIIFAEGDHPDGLYLILEGKVQIFLASLGKKPVPEVGLIKTAGDYFGEMSLLDRRRHFGTVKAIGKVKGFLLSKDAFFELAETEPVFVLNLARDVVSRTRQADSGMIIEMARAKTSAELFIDHLKSLISTSHILNSTLNLDQLLQIIIEEATKNIEAEKGTIYLVDPETGQLVSRVLSGDRIAEIRLPKGKGIAGHVAETGMTMNIEDAYQEKRFNPEVDQRTGYKTKTMLCMPMLNPQDEIVGVIQLLNKGGDKTFTTEDERFIEAMSIHASIAIRNSQMAEIMVQQESLAAVGNLAASIIHDFKSPMTVIRGYAQLLKTINPDAESERYINTILKHVDRIIGMTQEVLDFSRGTIKMCFSKMKLIDYFKDITIHLAEELEQKNITLKLSMPEKDIYTWFDPMRISRMFNNLVSNARDAMPDGGQLSVDINYDEDHWYLKVADSGVGIPEDILDAIFEPFKTFGKAHGTGLGLAITKKVMEQHQGDIDLKTDYGQGTQFTLTFPLKPESTN